jgi:hypothetical protein
MGNQISQEELRQMSKKFDQIMDIPCPNLDLGNSNGPTGYIDFILQTQVNGAMAKGSDMHKRKFIVWKAQVIIKRPNKTDYVYNTFTTFFKRYFDSSCVYHTCGHNGRNLFTTNRGATLKQMEFLHNLLSIGSAEINYEEANEISISYPDYPDYKDDPDYQDDPIDIDKWIFNIKLVDK